MDGKQARRLNMSSPLGQLFDHGLDTINSSFIVFNTCIVFELFNNKIYILSFLSALFIGFYITQLEEFYTGKLNTQVFGLGVVEAQIFISCLYFLKAFIRANFSQATIIGFSFFDLIFYPLLVSMVFLAVSKI